MKKYFQAPWTLRDIIFTIITTTTLILLAKVGISKIIESYPELSKLNKTVRTVLKLILQYIVMLTPLLVITWKKYKLSKKIFGINRVNPKKVIGGVIEGFAIYYAIAILIIVAIIYLGIEIPGAEIKKNILEYFGNTKKDIAIAGVMIIIIGPIIEEVIFRGFLYRGLANIIGKWWGSIISAGIFAVLHIETEAILPVFTLALIMNHIVSKTKSIKTSIVFHIIQNAMAFSGLVWLVNNSKIIGN